MTTSSQFALPLHDPDFIVPGDLMCVGCGYNLRSQRMGGHCPECGRPVVRSAMGNELKYANPGWLYTLRVGALLMAGLVVFEMGYQVIQTALLSAEVWMDRAFRAAWICAWLVYALLDLLAVVLLCRIDPAAATEQRPLLNRLAVWSAGINCGLLIGLLTVVYGIDASARFGYLTVFFAVRVPIYLTGLALVVLLTLVLRRLAGRMQARVLAGALFVAMGLTVIQGGLHLLRESFWALWTGLGPNQMSGLIDIFFLVDGAVDCFFWLPATVWLILDLVLYVRLRRAYRHARETTPLGLIPAAPKNRPAGVGGTPDGP